MGISGLKEIISVLVQVSCAHRERDATEAEVIVSTPKSFTSDADSAVAMDFSDVSASADLDTGCTSGTPSPYAHTANYIFPRYYEREGEEEEEDRSCTVCRIEVSVLLVQIIYHEKKAVWM